MTTEKQLYSYTEAWLNKDIKVDHVIRYLEGLEEHAEDAGDRDMALHYYRARLIVLMVNGFTNYTVSIILRTDIHGRVVPQPEVERAQAGGSTTAERAGHVSLA